MKRLLAATDFFEHARNAVHCAALIATEQQAQLELLHVISGSIMDVLRKVFPAPADAKDKLAENAFRIRNVTSWFVHELAYRSSSSC